DPDLIWSQHPLVSPEMKWSPYSEARTFQRVLLDHLVASPSDADSLLALASVKYVVLTPYYSASGGPDYLRWNRGDVAERLDRAGYLDRLYDGDGWTLYRNARYRGPLSIVPRPLALSRVDVLTGASAALATSGGAPSAVIRDPLAQSDAISLSPGTALAPGGT